MIRRTFALLLSFLLIACGVPCAFSAEGVVLWGDANGDGRITTADIIRLKNYLANLDYETGESPYVLGVCADANGDGVINTGDVIRLKNYLANLDYDTGVSTVTLGEAAFYVGFGEADITPSGSVPMTGVAVATDRMSERVLDPIYAVCVAMQDEAGERLLVFQFDVLSMDEKFSEPVRKMITQSTGVPAERILMNATHTHSGPNLVSTNPACLQFRSKAAEGAAEAAKDALADLDACTFSVGTVETDRLNFVRRYYKENGFYSDNVEYGDGEITSHETEIDEEMRIVRFHRKTKPDVVLANWQCHNHRSLALDKNAITSDLIGVFRDKAEKELGVKLLYLQGGAGNVNPWSRIKGEHRFTDYRKVGGALYEHLEAGLLHMTPGQNGSIRVKQATFEATVDHSGEEKLEIAREIKQLFVQNKRDEAMTLAKANGFGGYYEAVALATNADRGVSEPLTVYAYSFGNVGLVAAPMEMFCQSYRDLRAASPFSMTLTCGYSNGSQGYMPAAECFANRGYEVASCRYVCGTAEAITAKQLELLNDLKVQTH